MIYKVLTIPSRGVNIVTFRTSPLSAPQHSARLSCILGPARFKLSVAGDADLIETETGQVESGWRV